MFTASNLSRVMCVPLLLASCQSLSSRQQLGLEELERSKRDFLDSWTKNPGETFTTEKLSRVVDNSDAFVSFDAMSKEKTVIRGYSSYAAI